MAIFVQYRRYDLMDNMDRETCPTPFTIMNKGTGRGRKEKV